MREITARIGYRLCLQMKILVTGACGYKGSVLVRRLLAEGFEVRGIDSEWFGNELPVDSRLDYYKKDIRELGEEDIDGITHVIHLANVANDPAVELNQTMSWEINVLATQRICELSTKAGVQHLIYASSGSVYGVKEEERVTEDLDLVPISTYNKTKMVAERVALSYKDKYRVHCIRPATVCGLSGRMRLDVAVNMLTYQALTKGEITVLGGDQTRPNIHIDDMASVYIHFIQNGGDIEDGCFNAGFENISILDIAKKISERVDCKIVINESNDPRSYRQDSAKLLSTGFAPTKGVEDAIEEIILAFKNGVLRDDETCFTVKWMKSQGIK